MVDYTGTRGRSALEIRLFQILLYDERVGKERGGGNMDCGNGLKREGVVSCGDTFVT